MCRSRRGSRSAREVELAFPARHLKQQHARTQLVQANPHELEGVGVQDVEAAAFIHEHLGESGIADDGVDNKRVPSRVWDVVGVVLAAEGNSVLRPVEVG